MHTPPRRLLALVAALGLSASLPAAAGLACGEYRDTDTDSGRVLMVVNGRQALLRRPDLPMEPYLYRIDGGRLSLYDTDDGYRTDYRIADDGRRLIADEAISGEYLFHAPRQCEASTLPPPGACRADLDRCLDTVHDAPATELHAWCEEGLPFACVRMVDAWREEDATAQSPEVAMPPEPAVCKQGTLEFDETACKEAAMAVLGQMLTRGLGTKAQPLAAARLAQLPALCERNGSAAVCNKVAKETWMAGRFVAARDALQAACRRGEDPDACKDVGPLAALKADALVAVPTDGLPCGRYTAQTGLVSELEFGDRGQVLTGFGTTLRARLEDGRVHVRHDKGDDFVFASLPDGSLLGVDDWNRYALYRLQGEAGQCAPAVVYDEQPLQQDCAALDRAGAQACCARQPARLQHAGQPAGAGRRLGGRQGAVCPGVSAERPRGLREPGAYLQPRRRRPGTGDAPANLR